MMKSLLSGLLLAAAFAVYAQTSFRNPQDAVRYYEEMVGGLAKQVRDLQDENAKLQNSMSELSQRMSAMERNSRDYDKNIAELKKQISASEAVREKMLRQITARVNETKTVIAAQQPPVSPEQTSDEEFNSYVVQPGATLTAVSRAAGVSISAIKKANNMTSDVLRVGQKLKIPRKKQ